MEIWSRDENRRHWCLDYIGEPKYEYITVLGEDGSRHDVPREVFKSPELKNKVKELETENEKLKKELDETKKELEEAKKGNSHEVGQVHLGLVVEGLEKAAEQIRDELLNKQILPISGVREYNEELEESLRALFFISHCLDWDKMSPGVKEIVRKYIDKSRNELRDKKIEEPELVAKIDREELAKMVIKVMKKEERAHGFC